MDHSPLLLSDKCNLFLSLTCAQKCTVVSEEIKLYHGDRFRIAREICEVIVDILEKMEPTDKDRSVSEMYAVFTHTLSLI